MRFSIIYFEFLHILPSKETAPISIKCFKKRSEEKEDDFFAKFHIAKKLNKQESVVVAYVI